MTRSLVLGVAVSLALFVPTACGQSGQASSATATSTTNSTSATTTSGEGTLAVEPSFPDPPTVISLNTNPLLGAKQMKSWSDLLSAAESAAKLNGVRVAIVDPRSALGPKFTIFFGGTATALVGTDLTVTEGLGATGGPYLEQLVTRVNASLRNQGLRASRITDATIDCALLPSASVDELDCGVTGTMVTILVPHTRTSASSVEAIARSIMPKVTMLNPTGKDHP